jgi:hypothetical protein
MEKISWTDHVRNEDVLLKADSHIACRAHALFQQCRVLRESLRGSRKYPNC